MNIRLPLFVGACVALAVPTSSFAAWSCGIDQSLLPQVYSLDVVEDQLLAYVGPVSRNSGFRNTVGSAAMLDENREWTIRSNVELPVRRESVYAETCMNPPPDDDWLRLNKERLLRNPDFDQRIGVCATESDKRWGGISFYGGEGSWGVGGIVEQDTKTGTTQYYRPGSLADYSTSHLEFFADRLWIGTAWYGECGTSVGVGILSAYFANDTVYADWVMDSCGFLVSDMLVHSDALWIATEMGLSKVSRSKDRFKRFDWTNYVPTDDENEPMREVSCDELYEDLFKSAELASAPSNDSGHPYGQLWQRISKLRPNFAWQYVRKLNGHAPLVEGEQTN